MAIFKQIAKEFTVPLIFSILWVLYNIYGSDVTKVWSTQSVVNVFGPTFFLLSWLTSQFFRVKKQAKVENSFSIMEGRFEELLDKADKMVSHISGGDSYLSLQIDIQNTTNLGVLVAVHHGEHPLYDVSARVTDLQKLKQLQEPMTYENMNNAATNIKIGNMSPSQVILLQDWQLDSEHEKSYNISLLARNGSFRQLLRMKKVEGVWVSASKVLNVESETIYEKIDERFPLDSGGGVNWESFQ